MKILKSTLRKYWWGILIVILLIGIAITISALKTSPDLGYTPNLADRIFNFLDDWASAGGPIFTLILAIAAFLAIWQTRSIQNSEKRERLLNEIADWAMDVAKPKYALNLTSLASSTIREEDQITALQLGQASYTHMLIVRGKYIGKIALIFTQDLSIAVENVRNDLEEHAKLIDDWIGGKCTSKVLGGHNYVVGQSANKVIEEAAKIKTRDIS